MTETVHPPEHPREPLPLDSTAQLLTRITAQLGTQLSLVSPNGTRQAYAPHPAIRPTLVAVAHGSRDPRALHDRPGPPGPGPGAAARPRRPARPHRAERAAAAGHTGRHRAGRPCSSRCCSAAATTSGTTCPSPRRPGPPPGPGSPPRSARTRCSSRPCTSGWRRPAGGTGRHEPRRRRRARRRRIARPRLGRRHPPHRRPAQRTPRRGARRARLRLGRRARRRPTPCAHWPPAAATGSPSPRTSPPPAASPPVAAAAAPGLAAAPLGAHPALARLLLHRYDQALTADRAAHAPPGAPAPARTA